MAPSDMKANATPCTIRPYRSSDESAIMQICRLTAPPHLQIPPIPTILPYIFALPYIKLHPSYIWVVDVAGQAVGYLVAVPHSAEYAKRVKNEYLPLFESLYLPNLEVTHPGLFKRPPSTTSVAASTTPETEKAGVDGRDKVTALLHRFWHPEESILHPSWPALLQEYPAHIHIDILPQYQGQNLGRALMGELVKKLQAEKVRGIHLMKSGDNIGSERFYEKVGFGRYPVKMGGERAEEEVGVRRGGGVCMVRKIEW